MLKECQQEMLIERQREGELAPQLPDAVEEEEEGGRLLLEPGVRVGRVGAAELEGVPGLEKQKGWQLGAEK